MSKENYSRKAMVLILILSAAISWLDISTRNNSLPEEGNRESTSEVNSAYKSQPKVEYSQENVELNTKPGVMWNTEYIAASWSEIKGLEDNMITRIFRTKNSPGSD